MLITSGHSSDQLGRVGGRGSPGRPAIVPDRKPGPGGPASRTRPTLEAGEYVPMSGDVGRVVASEGSLKLGWVTISLAIQKIHQATARSSIRVYERLFALSRFRVLTIEICRFCKISQGWHTLWSDLDHQV